MTAFTNKVDFAIIFTVKKSIISFYRCLQHHLKKIRIIDKYVMTRKVQ